MPPAAAAIYDSIMETIGNTPLVRIPRLCKQEGITADVLLKLEFFNPISSVKDRIGVNMILQLERDGKLKPGATLIEPTSGNTGIGLAFAGAARGYRVILVMPDSMSIERRKMLAYLGAELHLTPRAEGMAGAMAKVQQLLAEIRDRSCRGSSLIRPIRDSQEDHGRGNLARYRRRGRCHRVGHRHRRDIHRLRTSAQAA